MDFAPGTEIPDYANVPESLLIACCQHYHYELETVNHFACA